MLRKYATLVVEDAQVYHAGDSLVKSGHRAVFQYIPREGYLYVRSRAISSRCNDNYDYFDAEEIKGNGSTTGYKTFIGKPVFVNHHNEDHRRMRGVIIDAVLHEDRNPDGSPDTWAEVLMEVDAVRFPKLAQAILAGHIDRTSMGVDVERSTCSVCANVAKTPSDYCFPAGVQITMSDGTLKSIEDVSVGDLVLTHDGSRRVTQLFRNHYSGNLAVIRRQGYGQALRVTHGHPILSNLVGRRDSSKNGVARYQSVYDERNWDWASSEILSVGAWVQGIHPTEESVTTIDVATLAPSFEKLDDRAVLAAHYRFGARAGQVQYGKHSLPAQVRTDDENLAFIAGLYLAEGSLTGVREEGGFKEIQWALGGQREEIIPRLQNALDALDAGTLRLYSCQGDSVSARLSNAPLAELLLRWCATGSQTKQLSREIMTAPISFQRAFLDGYQAGDSWTDPGGHEEIRTSSSILARQLVMLGSRTDDAAPTWFINVKNPGGPTNRDVHHVIHHVSMGRTGPMRGRRWLSNGALAQKVTNVAEEYFHGTVYNFEVEDNHSYVAEGIVVHNCKHIPAMKGKRYQSVDYKTGAKKTNLVYEKCAGLKFFENSLLVEEPADPTAVVTDKPILGPGLDHLAKTAMRQVDVPVMRTVTAADLTDRDVKDADDELKRRTRMLDKPRAVDPRIFDVPSDSFPGLLRPTAAGRCPACRGTDTLRVEATRECCECGHLWTVAIVDPNRLFVQAKPKFENPADHPFFQKNPISSQNIVDHWNQATPDEKASGRRWYPDAHLVAKGLGTLHPDHPANNGKPVTPEDEKHYTHMAAGMLANYSPQTGWETNQHNAARAIHEGKGIGGKGSGVFASDQQRKNADRLLAGEKHTDVLGGPKISDFAHLIEHGGDKDEREPHVVIDRHALSVATGKRMSTEDYGDFPKTQRHYYGHVVKAYQDAADQIGAKTGEKLHGHQVQAATWLVRQRLNQEGERASAGEGGAGQNLNKGREKARGNAATGWEEFKKQHLPHLDANPGTGYVATRRTAYGEQKAPADVDTLRDENCPICGESSNAYDGRNCLICGWEAPPKMFADPDLEMAKQVDLRKDVIDPTGQNPDGTGVGDFADESAGGPEVGEEAPDLVCDHCGTTFDAGQPQTTNTADPESGDRGMGPAEGDICPDCGQGELVPPDVLDSDQDEENPEGPLDMGGTDDVQNQGGNPPPVDPSGFEQNPDVQDTEDDPEVDEDEDSDNPFTQEKDDPDEDSDDSDESDDDKSFPAKKDRGRAKTK
jgi:hypothetical protein